jgi:hypothetical protein
VQGTPAQSCDESEVRAVVEAFGRRLQAVSVLSPDAPEAIGEAYSEFVEPKLLEVWLLNPSEAPGRVVSSPWPDRIEVLTVAPEATGRCGVDGSVVELTSAEVIRGGVAGQVPVHISLEKIDGRWVIVEYREDR